MEEEKKKIEQEQQLEEANGGQGLIMYEDWKEYGEESK